MTTISIADAKNGLPRLIHDVEAGSPIHITRRGKPVAVLLSEQEYQRWLTSNHSKDFAHALSALRDAADFEPVELGDSDWLRDSDKGRDFNW